VIATAATIGFAGRGFRGYVDGSIIGAAFGLDELCRQCFILRLCVSKASLDSIDILSPKSRLSASIGIHTFHLCSLTISAWGSFVTPGFTAMAGVARLDLHTYQQYRCLPGLSRSLMKGSSENGADEVSVLAADEGKKPEKSLYIREPSRLKHGGLGLHEVAENLPP
jgi:hypothetical protein